MKSIETMIAEYQENIKTLIARQELLEQEKRAVKSHDAKHDLSMRIITLGDMIQDSRRSVISMQQYLEPQT